jgi:hypothetical protein
MTFRFSDQSWAEVLGCLREGTRGHVFDARLARYTLELAVTAWEYVWPPEMDVSRANGRRELLVDCLLDIWQASGGELQTTTARDRSTPTGPLIGFLRMVAHLAGITLTSQSAWALVVKRSLLKKGPRGGSIQELCDRLQ